MNLHQAEWIAGELIAFTLGAWAIVMVWRAHQRYQETPADDERTGTTEFSSLNDD